MKRNILSALRRHQPPHADEALEKLHRPVVCSVAQPAPGRELTIFRVAADNKNTGASREDPEPFQRQLRRIKACFARCRRIAERNHLR